MTPTQPFVHALATSAGGSSAIRLMRCLACVLALTALAACSDAPNSNAPAGEWLKGDLHLHSAHSNDALDDPEDVVIAKAEALGMDYFVFTDHDNHVQGHIATWADPAYHSDKMVLLYGVEWTTAHGHANVFGTAPWDHLRLYALRDQLPARVGGRESRRV